MPKPGFSTAVMVVTAFLLSAAHVPTARSEPAFCLKRVNAYVRELDPILDKAKYSLTPINELNDRYFPFVDCDPGALIEAVTHSRFFWKVAYDKGGGGTSSSFPATISLWSFFIESKSECRSSRPQAGCTSSDFSYLPSNTSPRPSLATGK